jgi:hypothetical protein
MNCDGTTTGELTRPRIAVPPNERRTKQGPFSLCTVDDGYTATFRAEEEDGRLTAAPRRAG